MLSISLLLLGLSMVSSLCEGLENIALRKDAFQNGDYSSLTADKAVDGLFYDGSDTNCAHPDTKDDNVGAEWWVDLASDYKVYNVTIYNTGNSGGDYRLTQFVVSVGYSLDDLTVCTAEYTGTVEPAASVDIPCVIRGRYVHFKRLGGREIRYVTLCEVVVTGKELTDCANCLSGTGCTDLSGCVNCKTPGHQLPVCTRECSPGMYGANCANQCGNCLSVYDCNVENGECSNGCMTWWAGSLCKVEVVIPSRTDELSWISSETVSSSSLVISWQPIVGLPSEAVQYYKYIIFKRKDLSVAYDNVGTVSHSDQAELSHEISNLDYNTRYDVVIYPLRSDSPNSNDGNPYPAVIGKTKCGYPQSPSGVSVYSTDGQSSITVRWNWVGSLISRCDSITRVWMEYKITGDTNWNPVDQSLTTTEYMIQTYFGGEYQVRVMVSNNENFSSSSDTQLYTITGKPTTTTTTTTTPTTTTSSTISSVTSADSNTGLETDNGDADRRLIIIVVAVIVVVIILSVAGIVAVVLVLRYRRQRHENEAQHQGPSTPVNQPRGQNVRPIASDKAVNQSDDYEMVDTVPQVLSDDMETKPYENLHHKETVYENDPGKFVYEEIE